MTLIEMTGITKRFSPSITALDGVNFSAEPGEIHCLLGENGAGKTSLMNILYGLYRQDSGTINFMGKPASISKPKDAIDLQIGMVHQHFKLITRHTVTENIALGMTCKNSMFPIPEVKALIDGVSTRYNLDVNPDAYIWELSAGEQQRVEIIKVLCRNVKVLILDEPTSILTPQEAESLFQALRLMRDEGKTVIFITHKLDEVMSISDRVTVLGKGKNVETVNTSDIDKRELARMMVGREVLFHIDKGESCAEAPILKVIGLEALSDSELPALNKVTFEVCAGEVVGVAGVAGNGQRELVEVITGLRESVSGNVSVGGVSLNSMKPGEIAKMGVAHIPEDRIHRGTVPDLTVAENLMLRSYNDMGSTLLLDRSGMNILAEKLVKEYKIDTPSLDTPSKLLSGGNIQKIILARELMGEPRLILASHPTYGLDIGATEQIRETLLKQKTKGAGILLVSEDLDEILALSDRIIILYRGRIVGEVIAAEADVAEIGYLMAGGGSQ